MEELGERRRQTGFTASRGLVQLEVLDASWLDHTRCMGETSDTGDKVTGDMSHIPSDPISH